MKWCGELVTWNIWIPSFSDNVNLKAEMWNVNVNVPSESHNIHPSFMTCIYCIYIDIACVACLHIYIFHKLRNVCIMFTVLRFIHSVFLGTVSSKNYQAICRWARRHVLESIGCSIWFGLQPTSTAVIFVGFSVGPWLAWADYLWFKSIWCNGCWWCVRFFVCRWCPILEKA